MCSVDDRLQEAWEALLQFVRPQTYEARRAHQPGMRDAGLAQDPEMVRSRRLGHAEVEAAALALALDKQAANDLQARRVTERLYDVRQRDGLNGRLFIVLVPVVAFGIRMAGGYEPVPAELAGAALVIGALIYANLAGRQSSPSRHAVEHMFDSSW